VLCQIAHHGKRRPKLTRLAQQPSHERVGMVDSGGPGRPKGSRNKLAQDFIDKVYEDWQAHGATAIIAMREQSPSKYCALIAALIPQHFKVEHDHTLTLNEDELRAKLLEIRAKLLDSDIDPELLGPPLEEGSGG
jgi:hypothetical protein